MCGLAGYSGRDIPDPMKLRMLLLDNESRGKHSTGMYGSRMMRKVVPANEFINDPNFDKVSKSKIVLGHTRYATGGEINKENAHPFEMNDKLVGTHNGWLINEYEMIKKYGEHLKDDVDSRALYKHMRETDDPESFLEWEGAMALAFKYDEKLFLYRRESRPLFFAKMDNGIYYSSKKEGLYWCGAHTVWSLAPHVLYTLENGRVIDRKEVRKPRVDMGENPVTTYWEHKVKDPKLLEELTGKKPIPTPTKTHGVGQNQIKTTGAPGTQKQGKHQELTSERAEAIKKLAMSGKELSDSEVLAINWVLSNKDGAVDRSFNYNRRYFGEEPVKCFASEYNKIVENTVNEDTASNGIITKKAGIAYSHENLNQNHAPISPIKLRLYGFSENQKIVPLNQSKFVAVVKKPGNATYSTRTYYNPKKDNEMYIGVASDVMNSGSIRYCLIDLWSTDNVGVCHTISVPYKYVHRTFVNVYINLDIFKDMIDMSRGNYDSHQAVSSNITKDVTRIEALKTLNKESPEWSSGKSLPFLRTENGQRVIGFRQYGKEEDKGVDSDSDNGGGKRNLMKASYIELSKDYELLMEAVVLVRDKMNKLENIEADLEVMSTDHFSIMEQIREFNGAYDALHNIQMEIRGLENSKVTA